MKVKNAKELITAQIVTQLEKYGQVTAQQLHDETGIAFIMIYAVLKELRQADAIEIEDKEDTKFYKVKDISKMKLLIKEAREGKEEEEEPYKSNNYTQKSLGRDLSLFSFQNQDRGKGRTALAVLKAFVKDKTATLAMIKETFSDTIVNKFGVTETLAKAKEHEYQRYFMKEEDIIITNDKKKICVTNQWDTQRFELLIEAAQKIGYTITKVEKPV